MKIKSKNLKMKLSLFAFTLALVFSTTKSSFSWYDETHLAIAKAAGYQKWYNAAGADITKTKAELIEKFNHFYNNDKDAEITRELVMEQIKRYNDPKDIEGHLYGAIIASIREFKKSTLAEKYSEYHVVFCSHYAGDLSQPLHNTPYDTFNQIHHNTNDATVEAEVLNNIPMITKNMYPIVLKTESFEDDLAKEIARIANLSRKLGKKLKAENRDMVKEEAYIQLGHSASLFRAILKYLGKIK